VVCATLTCTLLLGEKFGAKRAMTALVIVTGLLLMNQPI
jgi:drug/metabolite transporter (DMT)-like permease